MNNNQRESIIQMIMRQTNLTYNTAKTELEKNDNNYIKVIKEALGINEKKDDTVTGVTSVNQHIYKEIRGLMDTAASDYRKTQQLQIKRQELIQNIRKKQLEKEEEEKKEKEKEEGKEEKN